MGGRQAGQQVAQGSGQFHQPVGVHDVSGKQPRSILQGGDIGAGENPLLVADLGEPQCPPQPTRFLDAHARPLDDLQPAKASVPGQQTAGNHLGRLGLLILGLYLRRWIEA